MTNRNTPLPNPNTGIGSVQILGILNLTGDSFSDGGRFLEPKEAAGQIEVLAADADIIDVGPESSNPDGEDVAVADQIQRLENLQPALLAAGKLLSIDTYRPEVARYAAGAGFAIINDISGFTNPDMIRVLRDYPETSAIMMFNRSLLGRADVHNQAGRTGLTVPANHRASASADGQPVDVQAQALSFFYQQLEVLSGQGIDSSRIIIDPGMGFFLGPDPDLSVAMLKAVPKLKELTGRVCISVSRKSFLGALTGRPAAGRAAATLASELYAVLHGADFVRTHDAAGLRDVLTVWRRLHS